MTRPVILVISALAVMATLSACGNTRTQKVASGAVIGGGVGLLANEPLAGALIGGTVGAVK